MGERAGIVDRLSPMLSITRGPVSPPCVSGWPLRPYAPESPSHCSAGRAALASVAEAGGRRKRRKTL